MGKLFLYQYSGTYNFERTQETEVFGAPKNRSGLETKLKELQYGDIIIIRDSSSANLRILGYCMVVGKVFDQANRPNESPYKGRVWPDAEYPLRIHVTFEELPDYDFSRLTWEILFKSGIHNKKGKLICNKPSWGKFFSGNFFHYTEDEEKFLSLIKIIEWPVKTGFELAKRFDHPC